MTAGVQATVNDASGDPLGAHVALVIVVVMVFWAFLVAGLMFEPYRQFGHTGRLLQLTGICHLLTVLQDSRSWSLARVGDVASILMLGLLAHLILTLPQGRIISGRRRAAVAGMYAGVVAATAVSLRYGPGFDAGCDCFPPGPELSAAAQRGLLYGSAAFFWAYGLILGGVLIWRLLIRPHPAQRRSFSLAALTGALTIVGVGGRLGLFVMPGTPAPDGPYAVVYAATLTTMVLGPLGLVTVVVRARMHQASILDATVGDQGLLPPSELENALATVLKDPTVRLTGHPPVEPGRSGVPLRIAGDHVVHLTYSSALDGQPELIRSAAALARLTLRDDHLRAELADNLEAVRASRARIVQAGDAERRRIERDLHDGAQQRLVSLAARLGLALLQLSRGQHATATATVTAAVGELQDALEELRELTRGLHSPVLENAGLAQALASLAERSPIPASVMATGERLAPAVERAAYFVAAEAVTNAIKHSQAQRITITAEIRNARLVLTIQDDGIGGARATGSGLSGLADRVAALDGRLTVTSPPGRGTALVAELPSPPHDLR
ncbi:hypothetical protein FH608_029230 [Nonomuraea phyllanthi]|uniref:histidine kinase n=1 Tax=Nonomuraea phyllanthi TaxID=2219224 RepID=A0A5C4W4M5_9ACTN|nr:histidine kinase [Nonomuraea phyllanthi]KAB8192016.1 hypothetical protein FH608_029230 [Nonomuraea phyllanthi]